MDYKLQHFRRRLRQFIGKSLIYKDHICSLNNLKLLIFEAKINKYKENFVILPGW